MKTPWFRALLHLHKGVESQQQVDDFSVANRKGGAGQSLLCKTSGIDCVACGTCRAQ